MCTLFLALRPNARTALAISGNRNEFLARPSTGPRVYADEPAVLMPRDEKACGTWLGLNAHGLFACVTNRRGGSVDPARPSRGLLVVEGLKARSAAELDERLRGLPGDRYNAFHLVYADRREGFVAICDGARLERRRLSPGALHLVTERSFGAGEGLREQTVLRACAQALAGSRGAVTAAALRPPMQEHGPSPLEGACVHADDHGYGTRSSLQLVLREDGSVESLWTEGHPCTQPPQDISRLAAEVLAAGV